MSTDLQLKYLDTTNVTEPKLSQELNDREIKLYEGSFKEPGLLQAYKHTNMVNLTDFTSQFEKFINAGKRTSIFIN
jgi:hypothetical protein